MGAKPRAEALYTSCLCCSETLCREHDKCLPLRYIGLCLDCIEHDEVSSALQEITTTMAMEEAALQRRKTGQITRYDDLDDALKRAKLRGFEVKKKMHGAPPRHLDGCRYSGYPWDTWYCADGCMVGHVIS